jgi:ubiquinone/menaquinone biosynthesis C-methylase UbiE
MSASPSKPPRESTYIIDSENTAEMARLIHQDRLTTKIMGGLLSEQSDLSNIHDILDIACGPGGWVLGVADTYRYIHVVGIDISPKMIEYARALAKAQKLENVEFQVMNALKPLNFPNDSFDIVNARFISAFMPPNAWPTLIQDCLRVCRPGGIIRLTEGETAISNSSATEKVAEMFNLAMKLAGQSLSPGGRQLGVTPMLERFLRDAGCENVQSKAHVLNFSAGMEAHNGWYQNSMVGTQLVQPFLVRTGVTTPQEFGPLYQQMLREIQEDWFCGIQFLLTAWGQKAQLLSK